MLALGFGVYIIATLQTLQKIAMQARVNCHEIFQVQKERLGEWVLSLYLSYCPKSRPICLMIPTIGISKKHLDFLADHCE